MQATLTKVNTTLTPSDVAFLDYYAAANSTSRSGANRAAVRALREQSLIDEYIHAFSAADKDAQT